MENFSIRPAVETDVPELASLLREIGFFETFNALSPKEAVAQVRRQLISNLKDESHSVYVILDLGGKLQGYAAVHWLPYLFHPGREGYISELFVREEVRGQGLGQAMLEVVKKDARQKGCHRLSLLNNRERESYHRRFYQKQGWEEREGMANFVFWLEE